jgi:NTE family protein
MLFHVGVLWRLNEMRLMPKLARVSSVSGGSLTAGRLAVRWRHLRFEEDVARNFSAEVAAPILRLSGRLIDVPAAILGVLPLVSAGEVAALFYRALLVGSATLQDLPDEPRFIFNATHLSTAVGWRFSKAYMGTYRLGLVRNPTVRVAVAIAASAAFPPFLAPLTLSLNPDDFEETQGADLYGRRELRRTIPLADGGVYDNLGLEPVWRQPDIILVSDAGGGLTVKAGRFRLWTTQVGRVIDTSTEQDRALRRRMLLSDFKSGRARGTLWRIATDVARFSVASPFPVHPDWRFYLAAIRTRLNPFSEEERSHLVNWGYLLTDVALRSYVYPDAPPATALPFPQYGFADPPPSGRTSAAGLAALGSTDEREME